MIKVHHNIGLLISGLLLFINGFTQDSIPSYGIQETYHFGALLPHRKEVNEIVEGHTRAIEVSFFKSTHGKKEWQQLYNYPKLGISALAMDLGNPRELGNGFGLFPYIEIPLNQRKINWRLKLGYGLGYIQKPFDRETNYKNVAIGSHFNVLIYTNMLWSIKISNALSTSAGLSVIHFSNGSFSRPNLGINILSLNGGLAYHFGKSQMGITSTIEERPHEWSKKIMFGVGLKEIPPVDGPKYFVSSCSFNLIKTRAQRTSYGVGADLFYNTSLDELIVADTTTSSTTSPMDNVRLGVVGIYSFDFGDISFLVEMGGYLFSKYKKNGDIYNRVTVHYNISDKFFINAGLKTHFVVADFIEFGVGMNIK